MERLDMIIVDRFADEVDIVEALQSCGGAIQEGEIIAGFPHPIKTYPSGYRAVAFHKVWIRIDDVAPEANDQLSDFLLNLGYKVESLIHQFVRTKIRIACIKDEMALLGRLDDCYRFELQFDTNIVSGNITKEAFEKAILEFRQKASN